MAKRGNQGTAPPSPPYHKRQMHIPADIRALRNPMLEAAIRREIRRLNGG